jgi:hypothetical protein
MFPHLKPLESYQQRVRKKNIDRLLKLLITDSERYPLSKLRAFFAYSTGIGLPVVDEYFEILENAGFIQVDKKSGRVNVLEAPKIKVPEIKVKVPPKPAPYIPLSVPPFRQTKEVTEDPPKNKKRKKQPESSGMFHLRDPEEVEEESETEEDWGDEEFQIA